MQYDMASLTRSEIRLLPEPLLQGAAVGEVRCAGILGVGSAVPKRVLSNRDLEQIVETSDEWIVSRTGIRERRIAGPDEKTSDLAAAAGSRALEAAGVQPEEIDLLIVATITGDHAFPATASLVQQSLNLRRAGAFDLSAACSGFIYALAVGSQMIASGMYRHILVIGAETLSKVVNWSDRGTCVLFGDGAGAVVLGPVADGEGFLSFDLGSDGSGADLLIVDEGGKGHPLTTGSDADLHESIRMAGAEVFKFAVRVIDESTRRSLARAGLTVADVDCLVPHQANSRIIESASKRLGIAPERVFSNVARYGNTSAASIPIALDEAVAQSKILPGDIVALVGFGAGLAWASCAMRWVGRVAANES